MKLYDTLTRRKEEFQPRGEIVTMYVCGVTPYDESHVGHAMSYIIFDVLRRYLEYRGYAVKHVQNFTDVDDKIIARAQRFDISARELAERYIQHYFADMEILNVRPAHIYPRVSQEVPGIIRIIESLEQKGLAYEVAGSVYFRVAKKPDYGKLSGRKPEDLQAGSRVEIEGDKEDPLDFALWKASKPGEPEWDSPWGKGRPGWHIECSAMALRYLGDTLDIHGGGQDLIFPHHENEIAQSESYTGVQPFVRFWMHNGLLQLGEEKMSKSLGNLVTIREAVERYGADALRLFVLSSHYGSPLTYTDEGLEAMQRGAERLGIAARAPSPQSPESLDAKPHAQRFVEAMEDDFNTAQAVAALFDLAREVHRAREQGVAVTEAQQTLLELGEVLGLRLEAGRGEDHLAATPFIELLIETRDALRAARQYELADQIRSRLAEMDIALEDTPEGTTWRSRR